MTTYTPDWKGENPYFLVIREEAGATVIDLNTPWLTTHAHLLRVPGIWMLCSKVRSVAETVLVPVLIMKVWEGEQPYYVARHILATEYTEEVIAYGIGKKRVDGHVDRLWVMPNGMVCGGDDESPLGAMMVKGQL